MFCPRRALQL